jgi:transcriptional regulator with GAF, ATPase, and Fis domain
MPPSTQVKLLRVLQERKLHRIGGSQPVAVDFRLLAATNLDLGEEVRAGRFREDLFYRLNVFPVRVPPLRERQGDIPLLANFFRLRFAQENGVRAPDIAPDTMKRLMEYDWPGNVRELENYIERAVIMYSGARTIPFEAPPATSSGRSRRLVDEGGRSAGPWSGWRRNTSSTCCSRRTGTAAMPPRSWASTAARSTASSGSTPAAAVGHGGTSRGSASGWP